MVIKRERFDVEMIPESAQFIIDGTFGKEVDGELFIYRHNYKENTYVWKGQGKSLAEYNEWVYKEDHELNFHEIVRRKKFNWAKQGKQLYLCRLYNWYDFELTYNKPKFKNGIMRAGDTFKLSHKQFPQLDGYEENVIEFVYDENELTFFEENQR